MKHSPRNPHFMKYFLLVAACFMASFNAVQAQGYHLGLTVSPNISFSDARELSHVGTRGQAHFGYGFIFDALFTESYSIGTGVNVFYNGGRVTYFESNTGPEGAVINRIELEQKQQYVEIPLTFKMRTKEIGYSTYYGQFGVGLGLNVRSEGMRTARLFYDSDSLGNWAFVNAVASDAELVSLVDETLLFRPSMIIGIGAERRLTGSTALVVALRYNVGLRSQYEDFGVLQSQAAESLVYEFDSVTGEELPVPIQMQGKTGQIELCFGLMF